MAVNITITLTGPFQDSDAQALQMIATGVAIMAGGELAAQIAASNAETEDRFAREEEQQSQPEDVPCGKTQGALVCAIPYKHRGRHRFRSQEEAAEAARLN